jgi:hypothetical protein
MNSLFCCRIPQLAVSAKFLCLLMVSIINMVLCLHTVHPVLAGIRKLGSLRNMRVGRGCISMLAYRA